METLENTDENDIGPELWRTLAFIIYKITPNSKVGKCMDRKLIHLLFRDMRRLWTSKLKINILIAKFHIYNFYCWLMAFPKWTRFSWKFVVIESRFPQTTPLFQQEPKKDHIALEWTRNDERLETVYLGWWLWSCF